MHPSSEAIRLLEKAHATHEVTGVIPATFYQDQAQVYAHLAIADALAELNRTIHESLATGFISVEVRNDA